MAKYILLTDDLVQKLGKSWLESVIKLDRDEIKCAMDVADDHYSPYICTNCRAETDTAEPSGNCEFCLKQTVCRVYHCYGCGNTDLFALSSQKNLTNLHYCSTCGERKSLAVGTRVVRCNDHNEIYPVTIFYSLHDSAGCNTITYSYLPRKYPLVINTGPNGRKST